ncbi:Hrp-dependent type III effector protein [Aureimonas sp. SA4125]|uniref:four-carbon acid sugar kinase family protein n=1 Tax=Aureimonas sp. SA4125 TaxID=2826993 RepID=UPI001CC792BD|nr:four-carbon acid sugar kinase family protein [Aureimonas sp. SA4125]BDA85735.1 Hrp-dependent type III effector protein [Aureimonas sp. SA4125]
MTSPLLLSYYGDDLTGSTDVMEAMELHGIETVLFMDLPTSAQRERFSTCRVVGLAGTSRSQTPDWMDAHLPAAFHWLREIGAPICHYKVCSTFDSAPGIGSIGRAIDIGAAVFGQEATLLVVGAPELKRYTAFGELFAGFRGVNYRIDRHPVMRQHPVTPMDEADLTRHLGRQTDKRIGLVDLVALKRADGADAIEAAIAESAVVMLDVLDTETQAAVGGHLWRLRDRMPFVAGSSGVEYALVAPESGTPLAGARLHFPPPGARGAIAAVSGSVSPTTERQIAHACEHGFGAVALDPLALTGGSAAAAIAAAVEAGSRVLEERRSVVLYTATGSRDVAAAAIDGHRLGAALGTILHSLVRRHGLRRACVSGGDTSSHAIRALGLYALQCVYPLPNSPGSPLCRGFSEDAAIDGLEIAFKGGQVGTDSYFCQVRDG